MRRSILITGASAGIGAATARALAGPEVRVWLTYASDAAAAERTAAACADAGAGVEVSQLDQRSPAAVEALMGAVAERWGALHVLVNNGGVCPYTAWPEITVDEWDAVLETNARGPFLLTAAAVPLLRAADGDRAVVNVASLAGQVGGLSTSIHYAASKAAVLAITRSFARQLAADGIRVNAVSPGPIATPITDGLGPAERDELVGGVPLGRLGTPEAVAQTIALLAAPAASFTTGATYDVNGGLLMA